YISIAILLDQCHVEPIQACQDSPIFLFLIIGEPLSPLPGSDEIVADQNADQGTNGGPQSQKYRDPQRHQRNLTHSVTSQHRHDLYDPDNPKHHREPDIYWRKSVVTNCQLIFTLRFQLQVPWNPSFCSAARD